MIHFALEYIYITQLGTLLPLATQPPTTTTITPSYGPDLQASNLINNIQKPEFSVSNID